jgi:hypothetical protein
MGRWGDGGFEEWRNDCVFKCLHVYYNWKKSQFKYSSPKSSLQARFINNQDPMNPPSHFPSFPLYPQFPHFICVICIICGFYFSYASG